MQNTENILLSIRNLKQYFPVSRQSFFSKERLFVRANDNISFDIINGETFGLVGESGCGKSTLGRTILRLYPPTSGSVLYYGKEMNGNNAPVDICTLKPAEMRKLRRELQIIFQDPYSSLNPRMTVGQIIGEGLVTHNFFKNGDPAMKDCIVSIMERCGLQSYMLHRYPHQFSGGQRQRISIARALAVKPRFIVCDECVSALDVSIQSQILNLLEEFKEREKLTYLFISHDLSVVRYISDRIGVMYLGNIVEMGTAEEIFEDPRHPYTAALLSSIPSVTRDSAEYVRNRIILEGTIPSPINPPSGCKFRTRCYMACDKCADEEPEFAEVSEGHFASCHFAHEKRQ